MTDESAADVEGALRRVVAGLVAGEVRAGQTEMARAILDAIENKRHVVVRAGTGTGKSLGYLVPAVVSGRRVVVATATKALQDQLAAKDLPLVRASIGHPFSFEVLKGRSNYLCMQRVAEAQTAGVQGELEGDEGGTAESRSRFADDVAQLFEWAKTTTSGDRSELSNEPHPRVWSAFSVSAEECPGALRCPSGEACFAEAARRRAEDADVVVANLHLVGADIASGGVVLPEHDVLVVDEAHELEAILSSSLGASLSSARLRAVAGMARRERRGRAAARAGTEETEIASAIDALFEVADRFDEHLAAHVGERLRPPFDDELTSLTTLVASRIEAFERALRRGASESDGTDQQTTRVIAATGHLREVIARLVEGNERDVAWVEGPSRPSIVLAPLDVSEILAEQVFAKRSVALTSATVPTGLATRLGAAPDDVRELDVGSPFDFEHHALLYCAAHLPDRRTAGAEDKLLDELEGLLNAAGGRTLALFTSWSAMNRAVSVLRERVSHRVLAQGEQTKTALLDTFRSDASACLFATMSFWQGIDVPGSSLSLVAIDRIPFPRPDDPLLSARRERIGRAAFREIDLPRAASLLAQGAGRLIRTASDRGVVAVLDPRLATASYRWDLIRALPPMRRTKDPDEVRAFLAEIDSAELGRDHAL